MLKRSRGFSLIEFMIAMTIGLFLVGGLVYLIAETSRSRAEIERSSRQIENGRYALERIAEDIRHAGYFSEYYSVPAAGEAGFPASLTAANPCAITAATLVSGMPLGIQAYDGGATLPSDLTGASGTNCAAAGLVAANWQPNTDILVVRRASTTRMCPTGKACCLTAGFSPPYTGTSSCVPDVPTDTAATGSATTAGRNQFQQFIQTTAAEYKLDTGANLANFTLTYPKANTTGTLDAPLRRYIVRIYFVAKCNVPASGTTCNGTTDDGGSSIPTLKMLELGVDPATSAGPQFNLLPVAEGIEHLQFDFGVDTTGDGVADGALRMCDSTTPCTAIDFSNVVSVQVNIVARNTETSPSFFDNKTYSLGLKGYTTATNDHYRRHSYSALVRMNNVAMRRE